MKYVEIFSDGACAGNPGPGGWGALLQYGENAKKICGGQAQTTNNQMELTAALEALKALKQPCNVILYTDSAYLKDGITKWLPGWKANGWKRGKKPLKNSELWKKLDEHSAIHNITWKWVRGHAGNPGNEMADKLANEGMAPFKAAFLSANK